MENFTLKFGKFKGQKFNETPDWYQAWLLKQDWFKMQSVSQSTYDSTEFSLFENGICHTTNLSKESAEEMLQRHKNCFPQHNWWIEPVKENHIAEEGILERHMRIAKRYW